MDHANTPAPAAPHPDALTGLPAIVGAGSGGQPVAATESSAAAPAVGARNVAAPAVEISVRQMFAAAGITRALVIDNAFDPPGEDVTHAQLEAFATAILSQKELHEAAQKHGWPTNGTMPTGPNPADALWAYFLENEEDPFAKLACEKLFATQISVRRSLAEFSALLEGRGVKAIPVGVDAALPDEHVNVVFLDYMLEPMGTEPAQVGEIALSKISSLYEQGRRPLVLLISDLPALNAKRRAEICAKVGECGGFFGFIKKEHLRDDLILGLKLAQLGVGSDTAGREPIREFVDALRSATESAAVKMTEFIRQLELHDYVHLHQLRLFKDGHPIGDYIQSLCEATLVHELARNAAVVAKRAVVNQLKFSGLLPVPPAPSDALHHGYHRVQTDPVDPTLTGFISPVFGNVYVGGDKKKAKLVLNAGCDLVHNPLSARTPPADVQPVYFLDGVIEHVESPMPDDDVSTTEALMIDESPSRIVWDLGSLSSVNYLKVEEWLATGAFVFAFCLRDVAALAIQREAVNHMSRIGQMASPPIEAAADVTVRAGPNWQELVVLGETIKQGARLVVSSDGVTRCRLTVEGAIAVVERLREGIREGTRTEPEYEAHRRIYKKRDEVNSFLTLAYWLVFTKEHSAEVTDPKGNGPTILFDVPTSGKGRVKSFALVLNRCHKGD